MSAYSNADGSKLSDSRVTLMTLSFALSDPPPVKISGGLGEISIPIMLKLYLRPKNWNTFDGHPLCMHRGLATKKLPVCLSICLSVGPSEKRVDCEKKQKKICADFYTIRKII